MTQQDGLELKKSFIDLCKPLVENGVREGLASGAVKAKDASTLLELFGKTLEAVEKRDEKKARRSLMRLFDCAMDLDGTDQIGDPTLRKAAQILKKSVIRGSERESLARNLAKELIEDVQGWPAETVADLNGKGGKIEALARAMPSSGKIPESCADAVCELAYVVWLASLKRLSEADFKKFLEAFRETLDRILNDRPAEKAATELSVWVMKKYGATRAMQKAFMGLLVGELVLKGVAGPLGLDKNASLTDLIVTLGVKIALTEGTPKLDRDKLRAVQEGAAKLAK